MQKSYTLYPLEDNDCEDDCYSNPQGDYLDQFNLPFLKECADFIDEQKEQRKGSTSGMCTPITIDLKVVDTQGLILFEDQTHPTDDNYLGDIDDAFGERLWSHRLYPITVRVSIC